MYKFRNPENKLLTIEITKENCNKKCPQNKTNDLEGEIKLEALILIGTKNLWLFNNMKSIVLDIIFLMAMKK